MTNTSHTLQAPASSQTYHVDDRVWVMSGRDPNDSSKYVLHAATVLSVDETHLHVRLLSTGWRVKVPYTVAPSTSTRKGTGHPGMLPPSLWDSTL